MNVLYAIQGTGNGHVSRAREVVPLMKQYANVDVFLSGNNSNIELPFDVKFKSKGVSFEYDGTGGIDYMKTIRKLDIRRIRNEIKDFPVGNYDLIVNDFEFISAWAAWKKSIPCLAFSHQVSLLSPLTPKPNSIDFVGKNVLKRFAPASYAVGLHFKSYDDYIFTPVIRREIRELNPTNLGHYTVYLPAVDESVLLKVLLNIPEIKWEVFSRTATLPYIEKNVSIRPAQSESFVKSLVSCEGLFTSAGFESPAEAMFLNKKVFVIPIKGQYEQFCNAAAMQQMGVPVAWKFDENIMNSLRNWIQSDKKVEVFYPDITCQLIEQMLFDQSPFLEPTLAVS
jgi:uncharacterized protein (TIGR00661 family)